MNEFANITDLQAIKVFFYIESVILVIALSIIGFFLRRRDNASITRELAVTAATEGLTTAVQQLKIVVTSLQLQYEIRQPLIDSQLELFRQSFSIHSESITKIDTRLVRLETEHKLLICKYPANNITINTHENTD
ncbi:MAG TPA: hypothetical protein VLQ91_00470 [Draconibacterium sp.]|nr:hypothetical protein [Draconibacterium sp.]